MVEFEKEVYYSESSPTFLRRAREGRSGKCHAIIEYSKDEVAGSLVSSSGYAQVKIRSKLYLCHIVVWNLHYGAVPEGMFIDHLDGDRFNNNIENLRIVTRTQNSQNCKTRVDNTSGVKGVTFLRNKNRSGSVSDYWVCFWSESGRQVRKAFGISKYGFYEAFEMACSFRKAKIAGLNAKGSDYTERHNN